MRFAGTQLSSFMDPSDFDGISKKAMQGRATERMYAAGADATVEKAGINADAMIQSTKYGASATRAQGSAQGQASMFSGIASGIGSLAMGYANKKAPAPKTGALGLGDGFNLGKGQAGLDPGVDLDPYLLSSPFSSIPV